MYASFLHDAVVLYALAVHDILQRGGNFTDGRELVKHMVNRTFEGKAFCKSFHFLVCGATALDNARLNYIFIQLLLDTV